MRRILLLTLLLSSPLLAQQQPEITEVLPAAGAAIGGTPVTLRGSGFADGCLVLCNPPKPPVVAFGGVRALNVRVVDSTRIEAVTPPHLPGLVNVEISQAGGNYVKRNAFTFTGDASPALERILLPIYSPPSRGAFGSEFRSELRIVNSGSEAVAIAGIPRGCPLCPPPNLLNSTLEIPAGTEAIPLASGNPGAFVYIPRTTAPSIAMNLRVYDVSRSPSNFGTEIPVAREGAFWRTITLAGIPLDDRYRITLRLYSAQAMSVVVSYSGDETVAAIRSDLILSGLNVSLAAGRNAFEPAYAVVTGVPETGLPSTRITITATTPPPASFWAFVTVTNNETQQITTISPQ